MRTIAFVGVMASGLAAASAQSVDTLAGMNAYNRGDVATAYRLLNQEAKAGDAEAQVNLGYLFARGQAFWPISRRLSGFTTCRLRGATARE